MERNDDKIRAEFEAALETAIEAGDPQFATELLVSRDIEPLKMIEWLEEEAGAAEPKAAPTWYEVIGEYAQYHLNERSYGMYADTSALEEARDRAITILGRKEPTRWSPG